MEDFLDESEYVSFLDIDEYLRLPRGCSIGEFVKIFQSDIDCILFNWIIFGPNGHKDKPAPSVLRGYTKRREDVHLLTKYIRKSSRLDKNKGFHHWPGNYKDLKIVNVLGEDMQEYLDMPFDQRTVFVNEPERKARLLETAIIHHYAFRTEKAFEQRAARGLGGLF